MVVVLNIIYLVYLGIYAYNNPEPQAFYVEATDTNPAQLVALADADAEGVVAVHDRFVFWFTFMFYAGLVAVPLSIV